MVDAGKAVAAQALSAMQGTAGWQVLEGELRRVQAHVVENVMRLDPATLSTPEGVSALAADLVRYQTIEMMLDRPAQLMERLTAKAMGKGDRSQESGDRS